MHELWGSDLAPLIFVAFFGAAGALLFPVMQGLRRRIEGGGSPEVARLRDEVRTLRAEVDQLQTGAVGEAVQARLEELEERVDFAERLVTRGPPAGRQEGA